ncbi:phosphoglycerate mutase GpmB [Paenibacillus solanacearum]|uniref:Phosphoglycerate mutase GpmB n=1 Tax=Paenibacillus solanacearum TaxID=2048548 RepID=A0A916NPF1_9BACL|nr:phosphoglycerate mutase GpmB [Paenibacillus solanacearum]
MENATTLYFVRHGQTEWNTQHRMQGRKDSPLTPLGVRQAEQLGEALRDVCFDIVCDGRPKLSYMGMFDMMNDNTVIPPLARIERVPYKKPPHGIPGGGCLIILVPVRHFPTCSKNVFIS